MTIQELLKKYVPEGTLKKSIAAQWIEEIRVSGSSLSQITVESRLSEVLAGKKTGLQFFFGNEERIAATLLAFKVPPEERPELVRLARSRLGKGTPIVFNLKETSQESLTPTFELIRSLHDRGGLRLVLLLTDRQYDEMPASLRDGEFEFRRVNGSAFDELARLREEGAVLVSNERVEPYERWLAVDVRNKTFDPPDAVERLSDGQPLDSLPAVERALDVVCEAKKSDYWHQELPTGTQLRALLRALAQGDSETVYLLAKIKDGPARLWLSQQLGVRAAATAAEWEKAREAPMYSDEELEKKKIAARHRPDESELYQSRSGVFHAFNPSEKMEKKLASPLFAGTQVVRHSERVDYDEILGTARSALERFTADDGLDDPFLLKLLSQLSGGNPVRASELHHALMFLTKGRFVPRVAAPVVEDWRKALLQLLDTAEPEARVRVPGGNGQYARPSSLKEPMMLPRGSTILPRFDVMSGREATLMVGSVQELGSLEWHRHLKLRISGSRSGGDHEAPPSISENKTTPDWSLFDDTLATSSIALRDALLRPRSSRLPNGWHLLALTGGLFARIQVRQHGAAQTPVIGAVSAQGESLAFQERFPISLAGERSSQFPSGPIAPRALTLRGRGFAADVVFGAAALLGGQSDAGASSAAEEARRRSYDD